VKNFDPLRAFGTDTTATYDAVSCRGDEAETGAFLEQLAGDGPALELAIGDMTDVPVDGRYPLINLVGNTLVNLLTQEDQVRCFENVATHLTDADVFVVEAFVASYLHRLPGPPVRRCRGGWCGGGSA